jgi:2-deoxy-D-gluconate 3-dehydrogenase
LILDLFKLTGKNALVTGSSRGLGAAIAVALAEAGANVALHGSRSVPASVVERVAATGVSHVELVADLRHPSECPDLIKATVDKFGSIDILVNNAGMIRRAPAVDFSEVDWNEVIAADLTSVFRLSQSAGRHMIAQGSGKIVNIASLLSFQGGVRVPAYAAAKGGVAQVTK